jgi:hypothetical protein
MSTFTAFHQLHLMLAFYLILLSTQHIIMKNFFFLCFTFLSLACFSQKIEMQDAKFQTGDDIKWSNTDFDDTHWPMLKTNLNWELQNYDGYNGFAWYRFHVNIPSAIKNNSFWKDSLRIFLAKIDDCDEVFLNGKRISKSGSLPGEKNGYQTTWSLIQELHIGVDNPLIKWDAENIIAVKVYDGGGDGGIFGATPYINMLDLIDGVKIKAENTSSGNGQWLTLSNNFNTVIKGTLKIVIIDEENNISLDSTLTKISLAKNKYGPVLIKLPPAKNHISFVYSFSEEKSGKSISLQQTIPYILTPKPGAEPKINGAGVFGVRPASPFLFKIPATGKKPLQYDVKDLPEGLMVNKKNGVISGSIKKPGEYKMELLVKNALGENKKSFTVKCGDLLSLTPPMGWNSWNCWGLSVSDEKVKASAKALMDKGLADHGWTYINIDDGWEAEARNKNGEIAANKKFPDMKTLGNWLHSNGLKFGIYSSPGTLTCGGYLGSYGHETQDATTYANWGIDYLKYDWCSYENVYKKEMDTTLAAFKKPYLVMNNALQQQKRDMLYSLCQYGMKDVWKWGATVNGNCWRTTGDIVDTWASLSGIGFSQTKQHTYAMPGRWNDPDMMIVGQVGWGDHLHPTRLTPDEQYTHVSLWSMLSAPLLIGCDISKLDDFTLNLLSNDEVIAIDQDPLGKQAQQLLKTASYQLWIKDLEDGNKALAIFNLSDKYEVIRFHWSDLGLKENTYLVRDAWQQKNLGNFASMFASKVAPHGVTLIRIIKLKVES